MQEEGSLWWLGSGGMAQVTVEYCELGDGRVEARRIPAALLSAPHAAPPVGPCSGSRVARWSDAVCDDTAAPAMDVMHELLLEKVVKVALADILMTNGRPALSLFDEQAYLFFNASERPSGWL